MAVVREMSSSVTFCLPLWVLCSLFSVGRGVWFSEEEQKLLDKILEEYSTCADHYRFDSVINTGLENSRRLPKIFIWCPLQHNRARIQCPVHRCQLTFHRWTSHVVGENSYNPRLVYDLDGNVVLVQAYYVCPRGDRFLSASKEILDLLPSPIKDSFPFRMSHRSACSNRLLDYLITSLTMGHSFLDITESILDMNYRAFYRIHGTDSTVSFHESSLYSSPSNDKLMQIFLSYYEQIKVSLDNFFLATHCRILSCDHTFKVSKHIGIIRSSDSVFVPQFQNLYVGLNENGEVVMWRLTTSTSCEEIDDLVLDLKERLTISGDTLDMIVVDDCCHVKNFYHSFFPHVPVKLDIFHAVQRIIKTLPKGTVESHKFSKEVGLVFRKDGDVGEERMFPTPDPECIESNLEQLLFKWKGQLSGPTLNAIENVREHVRRGCLSGIQPSVGTTLNERLHRHLKRSMLCDASSVSPELAIPILALVLYVWTCRRRGLQKHANNQRIIPIIPFEFGDLTNGSSNGYPLPFKCSCDKDDQNNENVGQEEDRPDRISTCHSHYQVANVNDLLNVDVVSYVMTRVLQMNDCWNSIKDQTLLTVISMLDLFGLERCFMKLSQQHPTEEETPAGCNLETLERNLASFGLTKVSVVGDGNCCFHSIIKCLHHSYLEKTNDNTLSYVMFLRSLGLGKTEKEDAMHLRYLMCQEILNKCEEYQQWLGLTAEQLSKDVNAFREQGWFNSDAGDIAVKVCSNILQIPIIVVTSYPQAPYQSFVPHKMSSVHPLYVAFNHSPPGHYDATTEIALHADDSGGEGKKYCQCGKQKKNKQVNVHSCTYSGSPQCSCLSSGRMCSRLCQCYNCCNPLNSVANVASPPSLHRCRCGRGSKKSESNRASCRDSPGNRKSKCPCLKLGVSCSSACQCLDCGNPHNQTTRKHITSACSPTPPKKRKRSNPDPYKRKGGSNYLTSQGFNISVGPWKDLETLLLLVVYELLEISNLHDKSQSIITLYNFVAGSSQVIKMNLDIATKRSAQIVGKLLHVKGRHDLLKDLMNNN